MAFAHMGIPNMKSYNRFFGAVSALVGLSFGAIGLLGLFFFAVRDSIQSSPRVVSGVVLASVQESPSSNHYSVRVKLDDGRQVVVGEEPSPRDHNAKLRLVMKDGAYEVYDPTGPWVGSLFSLASGVGLCFVGRILTRA
jgi:hypothetical protein